MTTWTEWEVVQHHVSICGRVLDSAGKGMPGIQVSARRDTDEPTSQSETGMKRGRAGSTKIQQKMTETETAGSLKKTDSRPDGTFFFLDYREGQYTLTAVDPHGMQDQKAVAVVESARKKKTKERGKEEGYQIALVLEK
jgi:hypothetical protein